MSSILDDEETRLDIIKEEVMNFKIKEVMLKYPLLKSGKDAYGHSLRVDDYVLYIDCKNVSKTDTALRLGKIKKICPKLISVVSTKIKRSINWDGRPFDKHDIIEKEEEDIIYVSPNSLIKIKDIEDFLKDL